MTFGSIEATAGSSASEAYIGGHRLEHELVFSPEMGRAAVSANLACRKTEVAKVLRVNVFGTSRFACNAGLKVSISTRRCMERNYPRQLLLRSRLVKDVSRDDEKPRP